MEYTQDQFDEALMKVISSLSISTIISYPGVMEILTEELNNDVITLLENEPPHNAASHVQRQILAQTGGYTMVDYFELKDGTTLGVTDEIVILTSGPMGYEDETAEIGMVDITRHGNTQPTPFPPVTAHHRTIGLDNPGLTGHYIESHNVVTDDEVIRYDRITMRNGIVITIDDGNICVYPDIFSATGDNNQFIGIITRP